MAFEIFNGTASGRTVAKAYSPVQLVRAMKEDFDIDLKTIFERNVEKNE